MSSNFQLKTAYDSKISSIDSLLISLDSRIDTLEEGSDLSAITDRLDIIEAKTGYTYLFDQNLRTTDDIKFRNISITENLSVLGDTTTFNSSTITIDDSILELASNNSADVLDTGFYAVYNSTAHRGLIFDTSDNKWLLYTGGDTIPTTTISGTYTLADLDVGSLISGSITSTATTEQLRLAYDGSNYSSFTINSGGDLTIAPSGGDSYVTGNLRISGTTFIPVIGTESVDNRTFSPSDQPTKSTSIGFGSFNNDNAAPFADIISFNGWSNVGGGNQNLFALSKGSIAARIYQESFGAVTDYTDYKDIVMTDLNSTNVTLASLSVSGSIAGTLTTAAQPNITSVGTLSSLTLSGDILNNNNTSNLVISGGSATNTGSHITLYGNSDATYPGMSFLDSDRHSFRSASGAIPYFTFFDASGYNTSSRTLNVENSILSAGRITSTLTTEQLRLAYDASNYASFTVSSGGDLAITSTGSLVDITNVLLIPGLRIMFDNRTFAPADQTNGSSSIGFGSYNNNNAAPYADIISLNPWSDASGGNQNLLAFSKSSIAGRIYQGTHASVSNYSTYKDMVLTDSNSTNVTLASLSSGAISTTGRITSTLTTEQLRLAYNGSNYASFTVSSGGDLTIAPSGNDTHITGNLVMDDNIDLSNSTTPTNIYMWTSTDENWRLGMGDGVSSGGNPNMSRVLTSNRHVNYWTAGNGANQGFAFGVNGGNSMLEIDCSASKTYVRGSLGVGINPSYNLDVNGLSRFVDDAIFSADVGITGAVTASNIASSTVAYTNTDFTWADGTVTSARLHYSRYGDIVSFSGYILLTTNGAVASAETTVTLTTNLPYTTTNFVATTDLGATATNFKSGSASLTGIVNGDVGTRGFDMFLRTTDGTNIAISTTYDVMVSGHYTINP